MSTTGANATKKLNQRRAITAALGNEMLTRQRVEALEAGIADLAMVADHHAELLGRGFFGRLKWLLTGK